MLSQVTPNAGWKQGIDARWKQFSKTYERRENHILRPKL